MCHFLVSFLFEVFSGKLRSKSILLHCTLLSQNVFSTNEMYITDSAGRPVPFSSGKVTVLLHFKQKKYIFQPNM